MYYLFINENQIEKYNGEILKRYVGNRLVKAISNPTDDNLKEFGYMELVKSEVPEYEEETQYLEKAYYVNDGNIYEKYEVKDIIVDEIFTQIKVFAPQLTVMRQDIKIFQKGTALYAKIKATNNIDFQTDTYDLVLFQIEER